MKVTILDAQDTLYQGEAESVILPAWEGEMCVLDFHQPFLCRLRKGLIRIDRKSVFAIQEGLAEMRFNELVLMVEKE